MPRFPGSAATVLLLGTLCGACGSGDARAAPADLAAVPRSEARSGGGADVRRARLAGEPRDTLALARWLGDTASFANVSFLRPAGRVVLVADQLTDPHLSLLDVASGEVVARLGRHGKGPGEFQDPRWAYSDFEDPSRLWVFDYRNQRFDRLSLEGRGSRLSGQRRLPAPRPLSNPVWFGDSVVANGLFPDLTLLVLGRDGRPARGVVSTLPAREEGVSDADGAIRLNRNHLAVHPGGSRFALAYQQQSRIELFEPDGSLTASVEGPRPVRPRYELAAGRSGARRFRWLDDNELAYVAVDATERFVYALFCGRCRVDDSFPRLLHVFRWDGELVAELALDRPVKTFGVDPGGRALYGVVEEPVPRVGEWLLPERLWEDAAPPPRSLSSSGPGREQ